MRLCISTFSRNQDPMADLGSMVAAANAQRPLRSLIDFPR